MIGVFCMRENFFYFLTIIVVTLIVLGVQIYTQHAHNRFDKAGETVSILLNSSMESQTLLIDKYHAKQK